MNIAVFADVHGRILLAFKVVERFQRETGINVDAILQAGDVGIFPDPAKLDKATLRHARIDESELGFSQFFLEPNALADQVFGSINCNMICVRGNHEDQQFLDELESQADGPSFSCDCYRRLHVLKTGHVLKVEGPDSSFNLMGVGRVGQPAGETESLRDKYIQPAEQQQIANAPMSEIDILLTHDAKRDLIRPGIGMQEISAILENARPVYHFFGHTGESFSRRVDENGVTVSSKLSDFEWQNDNPANPLKSGCFGLLRWNGPSDHDYQVVEDEWLKEYTGHTWNYI